MFSLREVKGKKFHNSIIKNTALGCSYELVTKANSEERFEEIMQTEYGSGEAIIYGFVISENGKIHNLHVQSQFYIMSSNGETFEKLG